MNASSMSVGDSSVDAEEADLIALLERMFHCGPGSATLQQLLRYVDISWWLDGVLQTIVGALGVVINMLAMPILFSKRLKSVFNCLLTILLSMETVFIISTCFETFRQAFDLKTYASNVLFAFVLYPLKSGILYYSIYMATVMARERFIAIRCPVKYHNETSGINPWRRAFSLSAPVFVLASIFVLPVFFEARMESRMVTVSDPEGAEVDEAQANIVNMIVAAVIKKANDSKTGQVSNSTEWFLSGPASSRATRNLTVHELAPSDLRFNEHYVLFYKNVANFLLTMVVPFALLAYYNWRVMRVLCRRRRMANRPLQSSTSRSAVLKAEEARKAYVLFAITFLFVMCHSVRFVLGVHECASVREYQAGVRRHCNPSPLWVLILHSVSNLMLTINSSLCSILYCLTSRDFQNELRTHYAWLRGNPDGSVNEQADTNGEDGDDDELNALRSFGRNRSFEEHATMTENISTSDGRTSSSATAMSSMSTSSATAMSHMSTSSVSGFGGDYGRSSIVLASVPSSSTLATFRAIFVGHRTPILTRAIIESKSHIV